MTAEANAGHPSLRRDIRRWDFVALVLNGIIGAGIFGLPSKVFALAGTYSLLAYLACAIVVALIILCFAELGGRFRETGGPYLYAREAFGNVAGFQVGWLLWLARLTAFASLCNLFVDYFSFFWPAAVAGFRRNAILTVIVALLTIVNLAGIRHGTRVSNLFTIGKLIPLFLFVVIGLFFVEGTNFSFANRPAPAPFFNAVMLLVFAFTGFEASVVPAGEGRDPQRHIPFALLTGMAIVAVLYILIQIVCIGTLPELGQSPRPLLDAAKRFMHAPGAVVITLGAMISIAGTLNGITLVAPRVLFAMAEDGQLPRGLAATHTRFRTPYVAILLSSALMLTFTLLGTFITALTMSTIIRLIVFAATCAAVPVLRRKQGTSGVSFVAPAGSVVAILALGLCVALLTNCTLKELQQVAIAAGVGAVLNLATILALRWNTVRRAALRNQK